jgi:hypothetical protein
MIVMFAQEYVFVGVEDEDGNDDKDWLILGEDNMDGFMDG